jgi:hypothetical protein
VTTPKSLLNDPLDPLLHFALAGLVAPDTGAATLSKSPLNDPLDPLDPLLYSAPVGGGGLVVQIHSCVICISSTTRIVGACSIRMVKFFAAHLIRKMFSTSLCAAVPSVEAQAFFS